MSEYATMSLAELRAAVTKKGMDPKGLRKAELLKTLVEYDRAAAKPKAAAKATPKATAPKAGPKAKSSTRKPAAAKSAPRKATPKSAPTAKARNSDKSPAKASNSDAHPKAVKFAAAARSAGWKATVTVDGDDSVAVAQKGDATIGLVWRKGAYVYDVSSYARKGRKPVKLLNASMARKIMTGQLQK